MSSWLILIVTEQPLCIIEATEWRENHLPAKNTGNICFIILYTANLWSLQIKVALNIADSVPINRSFKQWVEKNGKAAWHIFDMFVTYHILISLDEYREPSGKVAEGFSRQKVDLRNGFEKRNPYKATSSRILSSQHKAVSPTTLFIKSKPYQDFDIWSSIWIHWPRSSSRLEHRVGCVHSLASGAQGHGSLWPNEIWGSDAGDWGGGFPGRCRWND